MLLLRLICELAVLTGKMEHSLSESDVFPSLRSLIANVHVYPDFAVIERGEADHGAMGQFELRPLFSEAAGQKPQGHRPANAEALTSLDDR